MTALDLHSVLTWAPYPHVMTALLAATVALIIDPVLRFRDYRSLRCSHSVAGMVRFSGTFMLVFLQIVALFYLVALLPGPLRLLVLLFSAFITVIQLSYWLTLAQFMTATDLFLALTVSGDHRVAAMLSFFKPLVFLYTLPYLLVLSVLLVVPPGYTFPGTLFPMLLAVLYLVVSNFLLFLHVPERSFHLNPLTSFLRTAFHCGFEKRRGYRGPRDELPTGQDSQRPRDSIIYVIDESVRGSNLSLNSYPRPTTPFLQDLEAQGRLKNLGICVSAGSFSHISNAYLITGHTAFPDDDYQTDKNPTIFDYAKNMGYETLYIDINRIYLSTLVKAAGDGPVRGLDRWMTEKSFKELRIDLDTTKDLGVAGYLSSFLNEGSGYFILVNKKGLHFNYRDRYPDNSDASIWKPVMKASHAIDPSATGREKLVNTYDNGIRFQVDEFFRLLVSETTNQNYALLYTSDHGQTLAEHGQTYTHMKPDQEIVDVPAFLLSGAEYDKQGLLDGIASGIRVSHLNCFATLLDLMGVPDSVRVRPYGKSILALTAEDNKERYYMSGSLHGCGDFVVKSISTPSNEGWGVSRPVNRGTNDENKTYSTA
ncbi:MAG: sulfatase-like hydrolase/transferase [Desulfuromonadales bacterium]|nr:sulfatase-like hydrolase/transferase [Desulfuromonadales bacterium]